MVVREVQPNLLVSANPAARLFPPTEHGLRKIIFRLTALTTTNRSLDKLRFIRILMRLPNSKLKPASRQPNQDVVVVRLSQPLLNQVATPFTVLFLKIIKDVLQVRRRLNLMKTVVIGIEFQIMLRITMAERLVVLFFYRLLAKADLSSMTGVTVHSFLYRLPDNALRLRLLAAANFNL